MNLISPPHAVILAALLCPVGTAAAAEADEAAGSPEPSPVVAEAPGSSDVIGPPSPERVRLSVQDHRGRLLAEWQDANPCGRTDGEGATMALSHRGRGISVTHSCTAGGDLELAVHRFTWGGVDGGPVVEIHAATGSAAELSLRAEPRRADALTVSLEPVVQGG